MTMQLKVPSIVCSGCGDLITKEIQKNQPEASVKVDLDTKIVTVDTQASEDSIKEIIKAAGHTVA